MKTKTLALILGAVCATGIAGCKSDEKKQDVPYSYEEVQRTHQQKHITLNIEASACNNSPTVVFFEDWFEIECGDYSFRERRNSNSPLYNHDSLYIGNQQEYSTTENTSLTLKYQGLPQEINSIYSNMLESIGAAQAMELWETWLGEQEVTQENPKREYSFALDTPASACNNLPQVNMYNELSIGQDGHIWGAHATMDITCGILSFGKMRSYKVQNPTTASYLGRAFERNLWASAQ